MADVLVVAAHPDDEVLGCGAAMAWHKARGDRVHVAIAAEGATSRTGAGEKAVEHLQAVARHANGIIGVDTLTLHDYPDNRMDELSILDVTKYVEDQIRNHAPQIVYTHHWSDLNADHAILSRCVLTACRPIPGQSVRRILCFEVPSSTGWRGPGEGSFDPNWFVDVSGFLDIKLAALHAYAAEMRDFPHARSLEAVTHLARWRGASVGVPAAEAFVLVRNIET